MPDTAQGVLRALTAMRYVTPLREGGSLPAIVEADDDGLYVMKFRGAGQGRKALVAEIICGVLGRFLGLPVPEIVTLDLDAEMARTEPDEEIQELIRNSGGLNVGLDFLPRAINYDPLAFKVDPELASRIVWFDAWLFNVDRTVRNTNMLVWHRQLYLIDHGAALYFHHDWERAEALARSPFRQIEKHVLLPLADGIADADAALCDALSAEVIARCVAMVPDALLDGEPGFANAADVRRAYVELLTRRLAAPRDFVREALDARSRRL